MRILPLAVVVLLVGCTAITPVPRAFPHELMEDCIVGSELKVGTNKELSETVLKLAHTLKLCNIDKQQLRRWTDDELLGVTTPNK